jgi:hypothetical protein
MQRTSDSPDDDGPRIHENWFDDDPDDRRRRKKRPKRR